MIPLFIILTTGLFCAADNFITKKGFLNPYYAVHALHNTAIVASTLPEVWYSFTDFSNIQLYSPNYFALTLVFALHFYHILYYWRKFRFDDWLHHVLMIGIALPIGGLVPSGPLLGFSLFCTTGLPGGIDYMLLFLTRNGYIARDVEKRVNTFLNVWVRSPGCVAVATLIFVHVSMQKAQYEPFYFYAAIVTAILNYWNGQYFMSQIVYDAGHRNIYGVTATP